jgi:hypothetical protein
LCKAALVAFSSGGHSPKEGAYSYGNHKNDHHSDVPFLHEFILLLFTCIEPFFAGAAPDLFVSESLNGIETSPRRAG